MRRMKLARPSAMMADTDKIRRLNQVKRLIDREEWDIARQQIDHLLAVNPSDRLVREMLAEFAFQSNDAFLYDNACAWLVNRYPNEPTYLLNWIVGAGKEGLGALALERIHLFLSRWPSHPQAEQVHTWNVGAETEVTAGLDAVGLKRQDRMERSADNDRVKLALKDGHFQEALDIARQSLAEDPGYFPLQNNVGICLLNMGRIEEAETEFSEALKYSKENSQALYGLTRCAFLSGRNSEANEYAQRTIKSKTPGNLTTLRKFEALAIVADYPAIVKLFRTVKSDKDLEHADILNITGVALSRTGKMREAQDLWKAALDLSPSHTLAKSNLSDSRAAEGDGKGACAILMPHVLPQIVSQETLERLSTAKTTELAQVEALALVNEYPMLRNTIPWFLANGDPNARLMIYILAASLPVEEVKDDLIAFAAGRHGSDEDRMDAYKHLIQQQVVDWRQRPYWLRGKQINPDIIAFEVTHEYEPFESRKVQRLVEESQAALDANNGEEAVGKLLDALALEPNSPILKNNLAAAYQMLGDKEQFKSIILELFNEHPDYFFSRTNMATIQAEAGDFDAALALLEPLQSRPRIHISEFRALSATTISIAIRRRSFKEARMWLDAWDRIEPGNDLCERLRGQVELISNMEKGIQHLKALAEKQQQKKPRERKKPPQPELEF